MSKNFLRALTCTAALALSGACGGPSADERLAKGDAYLRQSLLAEAIVEYKLAVQADGKRGDARLKLADAYASKA